MNVINKWNGKSYDAKFEGDKVTLTREDGSVFTISIVDFNFNYRKDK